MNRVEKFVCVIKEKMLTVPQEKLDALDKELSIDFQEHFAFQNAQYRAFASGKITCDEASAIYRALGEVGSPSNGGWSKGTPLEMKVTVTQFVSEII